MQSQMDSSEVLDFNPKIASFCLLQSYPTLEQEGQESLRFRDNSHLVWNLMKDSTRQAITQRHQNPFQDSWQNPKLADSFATPYPLANFAKNSDEESSRIRDIAFFSTLYGSNEAEVTQNLKSLFWVDGTEILFNSKNGAYEALVRVKNRLENLLESHPNFKIYLQNIGGTFKWRKIADSNNLSAHSFGIAIDINVAHSRYWLWDLKSNALSNSKAVATIPLEIIEAFEEENFIWGGRWWHYDTMHFEYRPEILCYAKEFAKSHNP